jgi:hypothetical protein
VAILFNVSDATGSFSPRGTYVLSGSDSGSDYLIRGDRTNVNDSAGRLTYTKSQPDFASLSLNDAVTSVAASCNLAFTGINSGTFQLTALSGTQRGAFQLIYNPIFKPTIVQSTADRALWEGEPFKLEVSVLSSEPYTAQWFKTGSGAPISTGSSLTLPNLSTTDSSLYRYEAVSSVGRVSSETYLTVNTRSDHEFKWANPLPSSEIPYAVFGAEAQRRFVILGVRGTIAVSPDGLAWAPGQSPTTHILWSACGNTSVLVATGNSGIICNSFDGAKWTKVLSGTAEHLRGSAFGRGTFVAVGDNGTILTSSDGATWTPRISPTNSDIYSVTYAPYGFVAVGEAGTTLLSTDAVTWVATQRATDTILNSVSNMNGIAVAVGDLGTIISSQDGLVWTRRSLAILDSLNSVCVANGIFHVVGDSGAYYTSTNGSLWSASNIGNNGNILAIGALGSTIVAASDDGLIVSKQSTGSWNLRTIGLPNYKSAIAYGNDRFVVTGSGRPVYSFDGVTWTDATTTSTDQAVLFSSGRFVSVGSSGSIRTSTTGATWTSVTSRTTSSLFGITDGARGLVAVGDAGAVVASADGSNWTLRAAPTSQRLYAVGYGFGRYVAVGNGGTIVTSTDGIAWASVSTALERSDYLRAIFFDDNLGFITVGGSGLCLRSSDGITWQRVDLNTKSTLYGVARIGGRFCIVGAGGALFMSTDGRAWIRQVPITSRDLFGAVAVGDTSVLVGSFGAILRSGALQITPPVITVAPAAVTAPIGARVTLTVAASGQPEPSYQWLLNGAAVAGATTPLLQLANLQNVNAGLYSVRLTNVRATVTSTAVRVTVGGSTSTSRIKNLSVRTNADGGANALILGFVVSGASPMPLLIRAVGPSLGVFGISGFVTDPRLQVFRGSDVLVENDDWSNASNATALTIAFDSVGAFPMTLGSKDAAIFSSFSTGAYSAQVIPLSGAGVALVEAYDNAAVSSTSRLINMSTRARSGIDDDVLIVGFVVSGTANKTLLIRGIGPTLATLGVSGVLSDPVVRVYRGNNLLVQNDDWGGSSQLALVHSQVGAFSIPTNSKDASLVLSLSPSAYTVQLFGKNGSTGVALAEIYEVP